MIFESSVGRRASATWARGLLSFLVAGAGLGGAATAAPPAQPQIAVKTLSGENFDLAAQRGHVVLLHFWATWCTSCREEIPVLNEFYRQHRAQGLQILAVSIDRKRDLAQVQELARGFGFPAALARDASRNDFGMQNEVPVTFVIDADGHVRDELRPDPVPLSEASLNHAVTPLLAAPAR